MLGWNLVVRIQEVILSLLVMVYKEGPWWIGGWGKMQEEDICATLSHSSQLTSSFWMMHRDECENMIADRVSSHSIGLAVIFLGANIVWFYIVATVYFLFARGRRTPVELVCIEKQSPLLKSS